MMTADAGKFEKRGFMPLAHSAYGGVAWRGDRLTDFWMWNRQTLTDSTGVERAQTVQVTELKEAAIRYWRDCWVPVTGADDTLIARMENALRTHPGLKAAGVNFPDEPFLEPPDEIPASLLGTATGTDGAER